VARQYRTRTIPWLLLTTIAIGYIAAINFSLIASAQSSAQEKCAAEAKKTFEDVGREYTAEWNRLQLKVEVVSSDYENHFNAKTNRCLLLIDKTTSLLQEKTNTSFLIDVGDRRIYASYIETGGEVSSCTLMRSARQAKDCKSRDEFEAFVSEYMERQPQGK